MLVHTDQKPYNCELCDQSFRQKQLLRRHQNLYHNPNYVPPQPRDKQHECPECARSFRHKGNLIRHMAIHDPESSAHEKAMALKVGRQKKIQIIDGQQVEVIEGDDEDEDEETQTQMIAVEGEDGQQYVVLEVIQLQDGDGGQQTVTLVGDNAELVTTTSYSEAEYAQMQMGGEVQEQEEPRDQKPKAVYIKQEVSEADVKNCFGFDDSDEDDDEGQAEYY